jgi:hypothetical protein
VKHEVMAASKQVVLLIGLFAIQGSASVIGQITTQPYQYDGGRFTIKTTYKFATTIETDSIAGSSRFQPLITVTNVSTGRSLTTFYISENDSISVGGQNILIGNEIPGQTSLRENMGAIVVEPSSLGPGPLVFHVAGLSELTAPAPQKIRNVFDGAFYVWTIFPQSITPNLPLYKTPVNNPPPANPGSSLVSSKIHAVIISGRSDPAKIVTSQNVTVTGGIVALGKDPAPPAGPTSWSSGLRIVPDEALLTGAKIPPVTPNIIDVRIISHEVVGDLAMPGASPSP